MDKVACKWVDNSHTMDRTKVVRWMTAKWTWEAAKEVAEDSTEEDAEEADKTTVVETNTGTRTVETEVVHNNNRDTAKTRSPWEWWDNLRWLQDKHQWCLHNNSQWVWTKDNNLHNSNSQPSKMPCNFLRSTLRNLISSRVTKETTLLETTFTCQSCRPSVKNLPQPLPVCFSMSQLSTSSSCFPKTNTLSLRQERPMSFLFRARTNSSKKVNKPFLRWDSSESHELECKLFYIRTGAMSSTIFSGTVNRRPHLIEKHHLLACPLI